MREPADQATDRSELEGLIERCSQGDGEAWKLLVARFERLVYAIPVDAGLNRHDCADVVQTTFEILYQGLDSVREPDRLGLWLMTVARRQVARVHRRQFAEAGNIEVERLRGHEPTDADGTEMFARALAVHSSVRQMHEPCRTLVLALFFDPTEPSYEEIAMRVGRPIGSIGPLRGRCLERLRDLLNEGGFTNDG